jgi:WD40 repeat protein
MRFGKGVVIVPTMQVLAMGSDTKTNGKEIFACAFTQDSEYALTGSWDGSMRIWEAGTGLLVKSFVAGAKPLSACAVSPDGKTILTGSMDGVMACWDSCHQLTSSFIAHTRPISTICFASDSQTVATASWDKKLTIRNVATIKEGQILAGHEDIVAGCQFMPDMTHLLSWSHDGTLRLWDIASNQRSLLLAGHTDRVNCASVSPDGRWIVSASRDRELKLWDWRQKTAIRTKATEDEVRGLFFMQDCQSLVTIDHDGWLTLYALPNLNIQEQVETQLSVQCSEISPSGTRIALGGEDGRICIVEVQGIEKAPLLVVATQTTRLTSSGIFRLLGKKPKISHSFSCTCPACSHSFDLPDYLPGQPAPCPNCHQTLRFSGVNQVVHQS